MSAAANVVAGACTPRVRVPPVLEPPLVTPFSVEDPPPHAVSARAAVTIAAALLRYFLRDILCTLLRSFHYATKPHGCLGFPVPSDGRPPLAGISSASHFSSSATFLSARLMM